MGGQERLLRAMLMRQMHHLIRRARRCACSSQPVPLLFASLQILFRPHPAYFSALPSFAAGEGLVVSRSGPGVFLQGLAAYGRGGELIAAGELPGDVVRDAFLFSGEGLLPS